MMTERRLRGPLRQIVWFQIDETFRGLQQEKVIRSLVHLRDTHAADRVKWRLPEN